jgi:phosphoribosylglycinamide formyltransferase-1
MRHVPFIVFATGTKDGGGSGLRKLHRHFGIRNPVAKLVGVVSNYPDGGVAKYARAEGIPFLHLPNSELTPERYAEIPHHFMAPNAYISCSGWIRYMHTAVHGEWGRVLDRMDLNPGIRPERAINIHPALLSQLGGRFGGKGMWGHHVHEAVKAALDAGELDEVAPAFGTTTDDGSEKGRHDKLVSRIERPRIVAYSGFTMHFVCGWRGPQEDYDKGPVFAEVRVPIQHGWSADQIGEAVNRAEHRWQPFLTEMVISRKIRLVRNRVIVPPGYGLLPRAT